ncbi:DUF6986 family protein [Cryptosporangium phraense]|uniref:Aldolase n=1 Tax=Cryptosporangium phraense TaxID=2593070 RepID=A0A545AQD8_9ACTN|nr:aldolase/citrate lyase family protein [Cryptosporangium phraense]TQS43539.1 aldolase [Cryptosporangium phraense]
MLDDLLNELDAELAETDETLKAQHEKPPRGRQPVHTVYVPADQFSAGLPSRWGAEALELLDQHAPFADHLAKATGLPVEAVHSALPRVRVKLATEPIEDLRVDFEDGYGYRPDADEDADAQKAGQAAAALIGRSGAPFTLGLRIKSMEQRDRRRGVRTLNLFAGALTQNLPDGPELPPVLANNFVVTLPKVTSVAQVEAALRVLDAIEDEHRLTAGTLGLELQIELPSAIQSTSGLATVSQLVAAAKDRCAGVHYGTYDYSAALGVAAAFQALDHPVADHAKAVMLLAAVQAGVPAVDGSTNVMPTGDTAEVHTAWANHARLVRRSLERAYYQGWDMHPGHLVTRYLATYVFFRDALPAATARLTTYLARTSSQAGVVDEPATARALATVILRGLDCGALTEEEVPLDVPLLRRLSRPRS